MNSDLGNGSFWVEIRDAKHVHRCRWRSTWVWSHQLTSDLRDVHFLEMLTMVVSENSFGAYVCPRRPVGLHRDSGSCFTAISSLRWRRNQDCAEALSRVLIKQIAAWICCIARRDRCLDCSIGVGLTATLSATWNFQSVHGWLHWSNLLAVSADGCCVLRNLTTSSFGGKETNFFGSKSAIDSSTPSSKRLLLLHLTFKSMPKAKFWRCQHCRGRSRKRCQQSTSGPITAEP